ncbi:MAG TPA: ATP-binding protein [Candidatus Saccharimonadales bacterium]|nr:ATP-binding protein [Candidatus Saccharimonadales bacterium]
MDKISLSRPVLICLYGHPGAGKTYVARRLAESMNLVHLNADRLRAELFQNPRWDAQENAIILHLMNYMAEEFLRAGVGVVYDINAVRLAQRRRLRELARKNKANYLLVWIQIDAEAAQYRLQNRDRRTAEDKYAQTYDKSSFESQLASMQNPQSEEYLVISGKHTFATQKNAIVNRLFQYGLITSESVRGNVAMPELVNLIPNPQARTDFTRRNISIG